MVSATRRDGRNVRFVLRPNRSLSWREANIAFCCIASAPVALLVLSTLGGLWPILPFAGLELLVLWVAFHLSSRSGDQLEVITVGRDAIIVEKGRHAPDQISAIPRAKAEVRLASARYRGHPSQLLVVSSEIRIELGDFLNDDERADLAGELREAIGYA